MVNWYGESGPVRCVIAFSGSKRRLVILVSMLMLLTYSSPFLENHKVEKGFAEVVIGEDEVAVAVSPSGTAHALINVDPVRSTFFIGCQDSIVICTTAQVVTTKYMGRSIIQKLASPSDDTPALRAGNYRQPKCAEPWIEVKFENEKQGKVQVVASPLIRLTNKPNATIEDIGDPERVIASLGAFVTGNSYDSDELLKTSIEKIGDQSNVCVAQATAKGNTVVLFVVSASEKQWQSSQKTLQAILDSSQL
ncbi:unnamed protein product [Cochlearia groenlandica]